MFKTLAITFLALLLPATTVTSTQNNAASDWKRYRVTAEHFSVSLPSLPVFISRGQYGKMPMGIPPFGLPERKAANSYGAYASGVVYLVIYFANPKHDERLEFFLDQQLKLSELRNAEMASPNETTENGRRVLIYNFKKFDFRKLDSYPGTLKLIDDKDRAFALIAIGKDQADAAVSGFLQSLEIAEKPAGLDIGEGGNNLGAVDEPADAIIAPSTAAHRAMIIVKPEPRYPEDARRRQVRGTVVLKAVLAASGQVTNIEIVSGVKEFYATSKAAAAKVCFIPAVKDGHFVSTAVEMEYNFNVY